MPIFDSTEAAQKIRAAENIWATFQGNNQRTGEQSNRLTGIGNRFAELPENYEIYNNFPNPFNPSTVIRYALPFESKIEIRIYNIIGELVSELVNANQTPGYYNITFDADALASGIYIYRVIAVSKDQKNKFIQARKMILLK